jgi:hypothetical protein
LAQRLAEGRRRPGAVQQRSAVARRVQGMTRSGLQGLAASAVIAILSTAAIAEGQGRYSVNGTSAKDKSNYEGVVIDQNREDDLAGYRSCW